MTSPRGYDVRCVFEELFERYGLPKAIQSDNGSPFASSRSPAGLTKLSAWWVSLGIHHIRSRPGKPQDNGGHERMHSDIRIEIQRSAARSLRAQQQVCDAWLQEFNFIRPHEALDMRTPAEVYRPSSRRPNVIIIGGYPDGCNLASVSGHGNIRYHGDSIYIGMALARHAVGLQVDGDRVLVWFFHLLLGQFAVGDRTLSPYEPQKRHPDFAQQPGEPVTPRCNPSARAEVTPPTLTGPLNSKPSAVSPAVEAGQV